MASFDFTGEHSSIVDGSNQRVDLNLQVEYKIHPLLEDTDAFAQG